MQLFYNKLSYFARNPTKINKLMFKSKIGAGKLLKLAKAEIFLKNFKKLLTNNAKGFILQSMTNSKGAVSRKVRSAFLFSKNDFIKNG